MVIDSAKIQNPENNHLLEVENLVVTFETDEGVIKAVDTVSFHVDKGEIVGLVGESGCGKSVTALSIPRLLPEPTARIGKTSKIFFDGEDLTQADTRRLRGIRGRRISMIFQEPLSALSPLHKIGNQMVEPILLHKTMDRKEAWQSAESWLQKVGIADSDERMFAYPYHLSGGMQQRIMIAMALMLGPDLVIADEPATALDVTIQAQIFDLIRQKREEHTSILLITHDMGVIWEMCDRVIVMYASRIAEEGDLKDVFLSPAHPYTRGLLESIPKLTGNAARLNAIPGFVPSPFHYPTGCHFRDRCLLAFERCSQENPPFIDLGSNHRAACFLAGKK